MKSTPTASIIPRHIQICHKTPIRLRVKVPALRNHPARCRWLADRLSREKRFTLVTARAVTGSVILWFDAPGVQTIAALSLLEKSLAALDKQYLPMPVTDQAPVSEKPFGWLRWVSMASLTGVGLVHFFRMAVFKTPLGSLTAMVGMLLGGLPLFQRAVKDFLQGSLLSANTFLLGGAVLAIATGEVFAALEVLWIQEVGQMLEDYVQDRSRRAIRDVILVTPSNAFVRVDGVEVEMPIHRIEKGDVVVVHGADKIPVDGVVIKGTALVDESHITGHPEPNLRATGDSVFAGTVIEEGFLNVQATGVGRDTYLAKVTRMVEASLAVKTRVEKQADKLAARLAGFGLGISAGTFLLTKDLARTLSVQLALVSPCATVLAASSAVTVALAGAARRHVLVKGGVYLEKMTSVDCICFDKTGTLTEALPQVLHIAVRTPETGPDQILSMAATAQCHSTHPIARALVNAAGRADTGQREVISHESIIGRGVKARLDDGTLLVGSLTMMTEAGIDVSCFDTPLDGPGSEQGTVVYVAKDGKALGKIVLATPLKSTVTEVLDALRKEGVSELHLISGDRDREVQHVVKTLSLTNAKGDMLPEEKLKYLDSLIRNGKSVAMVGDGINDAPALARSHVGIALGAGGAEAAIEAADIALVDNRLEGIVYVRCLSRQMLRIIEQNHWFAVATDLLSAFLAMAGLLPPVLSGAAHILHTVVIFTNSGRLLSYQPGRAG